MSLFKKLLKKSSNTIESSIKNYLNLGFTHYQKGDYKRAIVSLTKAIELDPDNGVAYNNRGQAYAGSNQWEQAIGDFTRAIELAPNPTEGFKDQNPIDYQSGQLEIFGQDFNKTVAFSNRGRAYYKSGNLESAIHDFNKAIELAPNSAMAYYNRGRVYVASGDSEQAIRDFTKTLELDPTFAQAYNNRGIIYRRFGNPELAIQDYNRAVELDPDYAEAYSNRGFAYAGAGEIEQAIRDFSKAIEINPALIMAYQHRGRAYYESGNLKQAISDLSRAIDLDQNDAQAHFNRGLAYRDSGNVDAAYLNFLAAARTDPESADFTQLRLAYAGYSKYDPYYVKAGISQLLAQTGKAFTEDIYTPSTLKAIEKTLSLNYLHLHTHMVAFLAYTQFGNEQKATYHQKFVHQWMDSILNSGDGRSPDTAFIVISLDEEHATLKALGIEPTLQRPDMHDEHIFDIFEFNNPKTGQVDELYFNIDLIVKGVREGRAEMPSNAN